MSDIRDTLARLGDDEIEYVAGLILNELEGKLKAEAEYTRYPEEIFPDAAITDSERMETVLSHMTAAARELSAAARMISSEQLPITAAADGDSGFTSMERAAGVEAILKYMSPDGMKFADEDELRPILRKAQQVFPGYSQGEGGVKITNITDDTGGIAQSMSKVSEFFRRDSRRYDGGFANY